MTTQVNRASAVTHRARVAALGLGIAVAATGCPKAGLPPLPDRQAVVVAINYAGGCPATVEVDPANRNCLDQAKDCARVRRGATIEFRATGDLASARSPSFEVRFDPFEAAPYAVKITEPATFTIAQRTPFPKAYRFSIVAQGCKPIDPEFIVEM